MIGRSLGIPPWRAWSVFLWGLLAFVRHSDCYAQLADLGVEAISDAADRVHLEGESYFRTVMADTRPVLVVTMHMGDFQLGFLRLVSSCSPLTRPLSVFKMSAEDVRENILLDAFSRLGARPQILRASEEGGRRAFLALRKGQVVAMTIDLEVNVTTRSVVEFLGHPCHMQNGPATIALINRALVLPVVNFKDPNGRRVVRVFPPIDTAELLQGQPMKTRVDALTQEFARILEKWIHARPRQVQAWFAIADTLAAPLPQAMASVTGEKVEAPHDDAIDP